jgi:hypothetical protein
MKANYSVEHADHTRCRFTRGNSPLGLLSLLLLCLAWQLPAGAATLTTDQADYQPGQTITFTGTGWQPGEAVAIDVYETSVDPLFWEGGVSATADASGNIFNSSFLVQQSFLGLGFLANATGQASGLTASTTFTDSGAVVGRAPVNPPCGGFAIDGDLFANTPTNAPWFPNAGDWIVTNSFPGSGCGVLNLDGTPINPATTFHVLDAFDSHCDDGFVQGAKFDDNPATWQWSFGQVNNKEDINNALFHVTKSSDGHTWVLVAADRSDTSGDSYIDFEFLQNSLTAVTNSPPQCPNSGGGGTFLSDGPNCGRTTNDFVVTISFTRGGTTAGFFVSRWVQTNGNNTCGTGTSYDYADVTASVPTNSYYAAVNTNTIYVPYTAFGQTTYQPNAFAEAAVDLTALLGSFNPCLTLGVKTILIKTKESQSPTAVIVDFISPVQLRPPLVIGPAAFAGPNQTNCSQGASTTFTMAGSAQPGTYPLNSTNWTVVSGYATISDPHSLTPTVTVYGAPTNVTLRLTVTDTGSCSNHFETDDVVLAVNPLPVCSIDGDATTFVGSVSNTYVAPAGMATYAWTVTGNPAATIINGSASSQYLQFNVAPDASSLADINIGLMIIDSNGCTNNCSKTVSLETASEGCLIQGPFAVCANSTSNAYTLKASPGSATSYAWSISGNGTFNPTPASSDTKVYVDAAGAGSYTVQVTITFDHGATITCGAPTTVEQVTAGSTATPVACNGGPSTVTVTASGGTAPYQGAGTFTHAAGTYSYTVTDAAGCTATTTGTITQPTALVPSSSASAIACNGGNATVTVSASGGTTPYTGTGTFSHAAGTYSYTVTDANGCTAASTGTITQPGALVPASSATPIACNGGLSTVTVSASGGTTPYTGTGTFSHAAGTYSYTVTDGNGCTATTTGTITQPTPLVPASSATPIACNGGLSTVTVSASGGTTPYTGTGTFSHAAGTYSYSVTDGNGCTATTTGTITEPTALVPTSSATPIACNGGPSTVTVSASGGATPYTGTGTFSHAAGTYSYTVTDANGCTGTTTGTITQPTALVPASSPTPIACNGGLSTVTVSASGGTTPYTGTGTFSHAAGTYSYTVTDGNGCTATATGTITGPTALVPGSSATPIACNGGLSTVTVSASGGATPYTGTGTFSHAAGTYSYTVTDANGCTATTTGNITQPAALVPSSSATAIACDGGLSTVTVSASGGTTPYTGTGAFSHAAGTYSYTVTDSNGCTGTTTGTITQPTALVPASSASAIACNGGLSTVTVSASGGTTPYTGTGTFSHAAGTYSYTVTDGNGCTGTTTGTITQPTALVPSSSATPIACNGGLSTVTVSASGGATPYTGTGTFSHAAGTYSYSVTDGNGCTATTTGTITQPTALVPSSSATAIACNGGLSTVTVSASGGTTPYIGIGTFSHAAGTYSYTVTDGNGCTGTTTGTITQPTALVPASSATAIACNGGLSTVTVSASGGTTPYTGIGAFSHAAGTYSYTVTDGNGCTATTTGTIAQPTALVPTSSATAIACNGGLSTVTVSASGGTTPYTGTGTFSHAAGMYSYTVTDGNGCTGTTTGTINQPTALVPTSSATAIACNGGLSTVTVSASGGTTPYTGTGTFSHAAGTYSYTVTDANGCTGTTTGTITQPTPLVPSSSATAIACNGGTSTVTVSATGGTAPYTGTGTFTRSAGSYSYTVTDHNGCTSTTTGTITQPTPLTCGSISGASDVQSGSTGNILTANPSGGTAPYSFKWSVNNSGWVITSSTTTNPICYSAPLADDWATFTVVVTDANGCSSTCTLLVTCLPGSFVTDSMLCTFNSPFRLIFTQDPTNMPCYKLTASNPGQYYYNMTYQAPPGTPAGTPVTFTIALPYPFVTQGAQPIHAYSGVTIYSSGGQTCLTPGTPIYVSPHQVTLGSYGSSPAVGTTTTTLTETVLLPANGFIYLNIHLDYGLKKAGGYTSDGSGNAIACSTSHPAPVPNNTYYQFSYAVAGNTVYTLPRVQSGNDFKKNPGAGGLATHSTSLNPAPGGTAVLKDSNKNVLGSAVTDSDGWYMISYKYTGKATTFYVTLTPAGGGTAQTNTITLKANGYMQSDFIVP